MLLCYEAGALRGCLCLNCGLRVRVAAAKNLILAGPRSVTVFDPEAAAITDLQCNYYLRPENVGTRRDVASLPALRELNAYVITDVLADAELTEAVLSRFHVVVFTGAVALPQATLERFSEFCHTQSPPIGFVSAAVRGVAGFAFVDFGAEHTVFDKDGELCKSAIVTNVLRAADGVATVFTHDAKRHGFEDDDCVVLREIDGSPQLNDGVARRITNCKPFSFDLAEPLTFDIGHMAGSGLVEQTKVHQKVSQFPLAHVVVNPVHPKEGMMLMPDTSKFTRSGQLHIAFVALQQFQDQHRRLPNIRDAGDADAVVSLAKAFVSSNESVRAPWLLLVLASANVIPACAQTLGFAEVEEDVVRQLALLAATELPALCAFFGGVVAQEVVKFTGAAWIA